MNTSYNKLTEFYANKIINQTPIKINKIGLPDIGATCHYLQVDATHCPSTYRGPPIHMQLPNGKTMKQSKPCILYFPDLTEEACEGHIIPNLTHISLV